MPRNADPAPPASGTHGGRSGRCCVTGCVGVVALGMICLLAAYLLTGRYEPKIGPPPPTPAPNALDDYVAAGVLFEMNGGDKPMYDSHGVLSLLNESSVVQANQPALARLRTGFVKECGIPFDPSITARADYLGRCRSLARLLSAEADVYDAGGNSGRAVLSGLDAIQLGIDLQRGGTIIHGLTGSAIQAIGQTAAVPRIRKMDQKQTELAVQRLQAILKRSTRIDTIIENEKRWLLTSLARIDGAELGKTIASNGEQSENSGAQLGALGWHFVRDRTLRDMERYFDLCIREAGRPSAVRRSPPEPAGLAGMFVPIYTSAVDNFNRSTVRNRIILIELAIHRFRLKYGRLPRSLDALGLDPALIQDPESGRPIVYRPSGSDYLLYGIGPDGKDDGGVPADEGTSPVQGDLGLRRFVLIKPGGKPSNQYRLVPHMQPPKLPPGSPPLKD